MIDFLLNHWAIFVVGIFAYAAGWHLGRVVGINDGLRRAHEIIGEYR